MSARYPPSLILPSRFEHLSCLYRALRLCPPACINEVSFYRIHVIMLRNSVFTLVMALAALGRARKAPNILFILTDDQDLHMESVVSVACTTRLTTGADHPFSFSNICPYCSSTWSMRGPHTITTTAPSHYVVLHVSHFGPGASRTIPTSPMCIHLMVWSQLFMPFGVSEFVHTILTCAFTQAAIPR